MFLTFGLSGRDLDFSLGSPLLVTFSQPTSPFYFDRDDHISFYLYKRKSTVHFSWK